MAKKMGISTDAAGPPKSPKTKGKKAKQNGQNCGFLPSKMRKVTYLQLYEHQFITNL